MPDEGTKVTTAADEIRGDQSRMDRLRLGTLFNRMKAGVSVTAEVEEAIKLLEKHEDVLDANMVAELRRLIVRHEQ